MLTGSSHRGARARTPHVTAHKLRRFTRPEVLRQIRPDRLLRLLTQFAEYFERSSFPLPDDPANLDIDRLALILADAAKNAPPELIDALYLIDQMATASGEDAIRRTLEKFGPAPLAGDEMSHADAAVEAWLLDPNALIRAHASQLSVRSRTLRLFATEESATFVGDIASDKFIVELKTGLTATLAQIGCPPPTQIFHFSHESGVRYVVQRGGPFARHGAIVGGKPSTVGFEPLEFDIVAYDSAHRELAVKDSPVGEQEALRSAFGLALAGDVGAFARPVVVSLDPIRHRGRDCLWCDDVPGLTRVTLRAVSTMLQPGLKHSRDEKASDLFAAWDQLRSGPPRWGRIQKVELEFQFKDSTQTRTATLRHGASLKLTRDDDADLVQEFLRRRGLLGGPAETTPMKQDLWRWLERPDGWSATDADWRTRLGDGHGSVAKYLTDSGRIASTIRLDGELTDRTIKDDPGGGYLAVCETTGKIDRVGMDRVALVVMGVDAIAASVAHAMSLQGTSGRTDGQQWTWWLGEYSPVEGEQFPVYLIMAPESESFRAACLALPALCERPLIVVTPTRCHAAAMNNGRTGIPTIGWISLAECASLDDDGTITLSRSVAAIMAPFLRAHLPQLFGEPLRPRFPTPVGATWGDIRIRFTDGHTTSVSVRGITRSYTYEGMGLSDKRTNTPTQQWDLLYAFAKAHGKMTWSSPAATRQNQKRRERLAKDLRSFFGIDEDPFEYLEELKGWRSRFTVEPD